MTIFINLDPEDYGKMLSSGGLVRVQGLPVDENVWLRRNEADLTADVWTKTIESDDDEPVELQVFPDDLFEKLLDMTGMDPDQEKVKVKDMIWIRESAIDDSPETEH